MPADVPPSSPRSRSQLLWLLAGAAVGAGVALGVSAVGVFAVPLAVAGMGLLLLHVAYGQRTGPRTGRAMRSRAQHGV